MPEESQRVAKLLDHVQKGDDRRFTDFCIALEKSNQAHVAELLRGCDSRAGGDRRDTVPGDPVDMPLIRQNSCKLSAVWNQLVDSVRSDEQFLAVLGSLDVFSDLQIKKLKASY